MTGGGGGFGNPFTRDPERVRHDVEEGFVSALQARVGYGVVIEKVGEEFVLDPEATMDLRSVPREPLVPTPHGEVVKDSVPEGREAQDVARVEALVERVEKEIGDDPCRTQCPMQADPVRCPFHHPFAAEFWDAEALERWAAKNCMLASTRRQAPKVRELQEVSK